VSTVNKQIFNDPIYGFITIPNALVYDLIQHPYFQRLRRISQMGLSYLVLSWRQSYSFSSCFRLHCAKKQLMYCDLKVGISAEEENALYIAIFITT
jgi:hypothetical protein